MTEQTERELIGIRADIWNILGNDKALGKALSQYGMLRFNKVIDDIIAERARVIIPLVQRAERADVVAIIAKHSVASCNCLTKSPQAAFHLESCPYQRIALILDEIDERGEHKQESQ